MKNFNDLRQIGMEVNKKCKVAYGSIDGYKYVINDVNSHRQYNIVTSMRVDHAEIINNYLRELDQNEHIAWTDYREGFVVISIKASKGITAQDFEKILKDFSEFCQKNQYEQYCRHCGETKELIVGSVYGNNNLYCDDCLKSFEESQSKAKKANVPLGIIGALLGSIIGVVAWVVVYKLGYIAGLVGFVMAFCCIKGYEILGGKLDKKGVWISVVIAVIMLAVAEGISLVWMIHDVMNEYYVVSFVESFEFIPLLLSDSSMVFEIIKDLLIGYAFMAFTSFSFIKAQHQIVSYQDEVVRME